MGALSGVSRPWSCDAFVVRPDGVRGVPGPTTVLGKNSDRPVGEAQPLRYLPERHAEPGASGVVQ